MPSNRWNPQKPARKGEHQTDYCSSQWFYSKFKSAQCCLFGSNSLMPIHCCGRTSALYNTQNLGPFLLAVRRQGHSFFVEASPLVLHHWEIHHFLVDVRFVYLYVCWCTNTWTVCFLPWIFLLKYYYKISTVCADDAVLLVDCCVVYVAL
jgi:hypothetical protein